MSHAMKRLVCLLVVLATFTGSSALACTGFYVGKEASADGTTIIGHTVDAWTTAQGMQIVVPRVENEPGRVMTISDEASWPLPDTTYQYTATPSWTAAGRTRSPMRWASR